MIAIVALLGCGPRCEATTAPDHPTVVDVTARRATSLTWSDGSVDGELDGDEAFSVLAHPGSIVDWTAYVDGTAVCEGHTKAGDGPDVALEADGAFPSPVIAALGGVQGGVVVLDADGTPLWSLSPGGLLVDAAWTEDGAIGWAVTRASTVEVGLTRLDGEEISRPQVDALFDIAPAPGGGLWVAAEPDGPLDVARLESGGLEGVASVTIGVVDPYLPTDPSAVAGTVTGRLHADGDHVFVAMASCGALVDLGPDGDVQGGVSTAGCPIDGLPYVGDFEFVDADGVEATQLLDYTEDGLALEPLEHSGDEAVAGEPRIIDPGTPARAGLELSGDVPLVFADGVAWALGPDAATATWRLDGADFTGLHAITWP